MLNNLYYSLTSLLASIAPLKSLLILLYIYKTLDYPSLLLIPLIHLIIASQADTEWLNYLSEDDAVSALLWTTKIISICALIRMGLLLLLYPEDISTTLITEIGISSLEVYFICATGWYLLYACEYAAVQISPEND